MSGFADSEVRNARKAHTCEVCGSEIAPRSEYLFCSGVFDGSWWSSKAHKDCAEMHAHHNEGRAEDDQADDYYLDEYRGFWPHAVCRIEYRRLMAARRWAYRRMEEIS